MNAKLIVLIVVAAGLAVFLFTRKTGDNTTITEATSQPKSNTAYWNEPLPSGYKLLEDGKTPKFDVECVRIFDKPQDILEFHVTEEHGWAADGIRLEFWYRFKDEDSGEWIDDKMNAVAHVARKRLDFNETLVEFTTLLPIEYRHLKINLGDTNSENWHAEVVDWARVMEPAD
jgi:hypothetical protein